MKGNKEKIGKKEMLKEKKQGLSVEGDEKRRAVDSHWGRQ